MALVPKLFISNILRARNVLQQWKALPKLPALNNVRGSSYLSSPPVRDINEYPEVEVVQNPPEWKFVERLLPPITVPKPKLQSEYASGWKRPLEVDPEKQKYFVARTKNHMVPVYLQTRFRGQRRITLVRLIHGDIWELERDLRVVVERARNGKLCASRVNEMSGQIQFHGDYVDVVREYLKERGF